MNTANKNRFVPAFENLEKRELLTAGLSITANLDNRGTLTVNGTNGGDHIDIRRSGDNLGVYNSFGNQLIANFNIHQVNTLVVNDYDGTNFVHVDLPPGADSARIQTYLYAGNGNNMLQGNAFGNNYLYAGDGNDTLIGGNGNDTLIAGDGNDLLKSMNSGDKTFYVGRGQDMVAGGSGRNVYHLSNLSEQDSDFFNPNSGSNYYVHDPAKPAALDPSGPLPAPQVFATLAHRTLTIVGTDGNDQIVLHGGQNGSAIRIDGATVYQDTTGPLTWVDPSWFDRVLVNTGKGDDVVDLRDFSNPTAFRGVHVTGDVGNRMVSGNASTTPYVVEGTKGVNFIDGNGWKLDASRPAGADFFAAQWAVPSAPGKPAVTPHDVVQGDTADTCWALAAISSVVTHQDLSRGIHYLGNGQYRVELYNAAGKHDDQVVTFDGHQYAGDAKSVDPGEFWVILYQRALLQQRGVNWKDATQVTKASGSAGAALAALTGKPTAFFQANDQAALREALKEGLSVVADTGTHLTTDILAATRHSYQVIGVLPDGRVSLRNPWGYDGGKTPFGNPNDGLVIVSWTDFVGSMNGFWVSGGQNIHAAPAQAVAPAKPAVPATKPKIGVAARQAIEDLVWAGLAG